MALAPGVQAKTFGIGKVARGGNTRGGYNTSRPFVSIGGIQYGTKPADPTKRVLIADLSIHDILNETPDTCQFKTVGFTPQLGQEIVITLGTPNSLTRHFAGHIISEEQGYFVGKPANSFHAPNGIDYTWIAGYRLALRSYTGQSAGVIARDLMTFADPVFTTKNVAAELDGIYLDEITFTNTYVPDALTQLVQRIGGYWYIDYFKDLHCFVTPEAPTIFPPPVALTPSHNSLADFQVHRDYSQAVTRAFCEGGGGQVVADLDAGNTIIPVDTLAWYQAGGGVVTTGQQRINYTGLQAAGDVGTLVGPGAGPSAAPTVAASATAGGLSQGTYQYAYTQVTASGESKPSPVSAAVTLNKIADPTGAPGISTGGGWCNFFGAGVTVQWCYNWTPGPGAADADTIHTANSAVAGPYTTVLYGAGSPGGYIAAPNLTYYHSPDPRVKWITIYFQVPSVGPNFKRYFSLPNNPAAAGSPATYSMNGLTPSPPQADLVAGNNTTAPTSLQIDGIAVGQGTVTSRKLYRTVVNGAQLKLVTTIADNTTTTYTDTLADASLGVNAPTSDTSGLQMPAGTVPAGSTSLPVASIAPFTPNYGGWAIIGNGQQIIRYQDARGGSLLGIPLSGSGSISAPVAYNSTVTAAPALYCTGQIYPIKQGDDLNILVQVDDTAAQAALKSALGGGSYTGIKSAYVQDRRLSYTEALARANATLKQRNHIDVSISYTCRDPASVTGRTIHVDLPAPTSVTGDFKIQDVTISKFSGVKEQMPTFSVQASTNRYTFEDLIRQARSDIGA